MMTYLCPLDGELQNYDRWQTRREGWFLFEELILVLLRCKNITIF